MKHAALIPFLAIATLCGPARAQGESLGTPHITVNGTARKEVIPDRLHWSLMVKNTGLDLPKVAEQHAAKVAALLALLRSHGVADKDMQTAQMQLSENRVYRRDEWVKEGYAAETAATFKLDDLGKYKDLWLALAGLSGVSVNGVSFDHTRRIELNKEVRKLALEAAREKAATMAGDLGSRLGEPLAIEEDLSVSEGWNALNRSLNNTMVQAVAGPAAGDQEEFLAPGSIPVTIRVRVTFRLLNPGT